MNNEIKPRVWVGNLGAYNAGKLIGEWVDATDNLAETVTGMVAAWYAANPMDGDEYYIGDYDDFGGAAPKTEWPNLDEVEALANALVDATDPAALATFLEYGCGGDMDRLGENFEHAYRGRFNNETDFARDYVEATGMLGGVPEDVAGYFDYEALAHDMKAGGDYWFAPAKLGVYVFDNTV